MPNYGTKGKGGAKPGCKKPEGAGRQKGSLNKGTQWGREIAEILKTLDCCPFTGMALIGMNKIPCYTCLGEKEIAAKCNADFGNCGTLEVCPSCRGTGYEPIDMGVRNRAYSELAQYLAPKRKAIEQTNKTLIGVVVKDYRWQSGESGILLEHDDGAETVGDFLTIKTLE